MAGGLERCHGNNRRRQRPQRLSDASSTHRPLDQASDDSHGASVGSHSQPEPRHLLLVAYSLTHSAFLAASDLAHSHSHSHSHSHRPHRPLHLHLVVLTSPSTTSQRRASESALAGILAIKGFDQVRYRPTVSPASSTGRDARRQGDRASTVHAKVLYRALHSASLSSTVLAHPDDHVQDRTDPDQGNGTLGSIIDSVAFVGFPCGSSDPDSDSGNPTGTLEACVAIVATCLCSRLALSGSYTFQDASEDDPARTGHTGKGKAKARNSRPTVGVYLDPIPFSAMPEDGPGTDEDRFRVARRVTGAFQLSAAQYTGAIGLGSLIYSSSLRLTSASASTSTSGRHAVGMNDKEKDKEAHYARRRSSPVRTAVVIGADPSQDDPRTAKRRSEGHLFVSSDVTFESFSRVDEEAPEAELPTLKRLSNLFIGGDEDTSEELGSLGLDFSDPWRFRTSSDDEHADPGVGFTGQTVVAPLTPPMTPPRRPSETGSVVAEGEGTQGPQGIRVEPDDGVEYFSSGGYADEGLGGQGAGGFVGDSIVGKLPCGVDVRLSTLRDPASAPSPAPPTTTPPLRAPSLHRSGPPLVGLGLDAGSPSYRARGGLLTPPKSPQVLGFHRSRSPSPPSKTPKPKLTPLWIPNSPFDLPSQPRQRQDFDRYFFPPSRDFPAEPEWIEPVEVEPPKPAGWQYRRQPLTPVAIMDPSAAAPLLPPLPIFPAPAAVELVDPEYAPMDSYGRPTLPSRTSTASTYDSLSFYSRSSGPPSRVPTVIVTAPARKESIARVGRNVKMRELRALLRQRQEKANTTVEGLANRYISAR